MSVCIRRCVWKQWVFCNAQKGIALSSIYNSSQRRSQCPTRRRYQDHFRCKSSKCSRESSSLLRAALSLSSFRNFSENASPKQDGFTPITSKLSSKPLRMKLKKNLLHLFTRLLEIAQDLSNFSHFKGAKIENYSNLLPPFLHFLKLWIKRGIFAWKRRSLWKTSRRD